MSSNVQLSWLGRCSPDHSRCVFSGMKFVQSIPLLYSINININHHIINRENPPLASRANKKGIKQVISSAEPAPPSPPTPRPGIPIVTRTCLHHIDHLCVRPRVRMFRIDNMYLLSMRGPGVANTLLWQTLLAYRHHHSTVVRPDSPVLASRRAHVLNAVAAAPSRRDQTRYM
jgi:hypothetical protein